MIQPLIPYAIRGATWYQGERNAKTYTGWEYRYLLPHMVKTWRELWAERAGDWLSEEALTGLLLVLAVDLFVLPVLGPNLGQVVLNIVFSILLFTGLAAVGDAVYILGETLSDIHQFDPATDTVTNTLEHPTSAFPRSPTAAILRQ